MVRTNEGGSVLSFVVVGVILAILMVSGVVLVRQQSINSHKPAPQKVVKTDKNPTTTPAPSGGSATPAPQPKAPSSGSTTTPAPQAPATGSTTPAPNKELPHTGPAETAMTVLGLGLLTASSVAYLRSRRSAPLAY